MVAGVGKMPYRRFFLIDVFGGFVWIGSFIALGYGFGNLPVIKDNFMIVVFAIIILSVMPGVIAAIKARKQKLKTCH